MSFDFRSVADLQQMPQYNQLVSLRESLQPLLPQGDASGLLSMDPGELKGFPSKRGPMATFKGNLVTYPQYIRLMSLQARVVKLDQVIRSLEAKYPMSTLESMPKWHTLLKMYGSLKGMLPEDYMPEDEDLVSSVQEELIEGTIH